VNLNEALKQGGGRGGPAGNRGLRGALVISEVALSLLLLVGAALMIQGFARLRSVDPGFPVRNLLTMRVPLSFEKYGADARKIAFYREVLGRIQALPGVVSAGFTIGVPVAFKGWFNAVIVEGAGVPSGGNVPTVNYRAVTPGYLQTLGVPLRRGRYLEESDGPDRPLVAVINEAMGRKFWPGQDPVGKRFKQGDGRPEAPWCTVAGVVGDIRQAGLDTPARPEMYLPYQQQHPLPHGLVIRTSVDPMSVAAAVRREIQAIDPEQPVASVMTMEEVLDRDVFSSRLQSTLLAAFSALAVLLAALGIYGVLSYTVAQRRREFGVRLALGADRRDLMYSVVRHGLTLASAGIAAGAAAALVLTRLLGSWLHGVSPRDPWTLAGTGLLMMLIAAVAAAVPARRATAVDPMVTLRDE
jgi:putative ABC transport system permease protein